MLGGCRGLDDIPLQYLVRWIIAQLSRSNHHTRDIKDLFLRTDVYNPHSINIKRIGSTNTSSKQHTHSINSHQKYNFPATKNITQVLPTASNLPNRNIAKMGLIKTAMMSGAAMYGVNQLAKTARHHDDNRRRSPDRQYRMDDRDARSYYNPINQNATDRRDHNDYNKNNNIQYYGSRGPQPREPGYHEDGTRFFDAKGAYGDASPQQYYSRSYDERTAVGSNSEYFGSHGAPLRQGYVVPDDISEPGERESGR
jgi:hypothetical protein